MVASSLTTLLNCNDYNLSKEDKVILMIEGTVGGAGSIVCIAAVLLALYLKLHRKIVYRLAIYQVVSALAFGITCIMDASQLLAEQNHISLPLCLTVAFLTTYTLWLKLAFTVVVSLHLFIFAVCYTNLKKFEVLYLVMSFVLPLAISAIPFTTHSYGYQNGGWCWIQDQDQDGNCTTHDNVPGQIEEYVIWFVPAIIGLLASSLLVIAMVTILCCRIHRKHNRPGEEQYKNALKQMLPLVVYPIVFCTLLLVSMSNWIYSEIGSSTHKYEYMFAITAEICFTGFTWTAGLCLLVHVCVLSKMKRSGRKTVPTDDNKFIARGITSVNTVRSSTYFSVPIESDKD